MDFFIHNVNISHLIHGTLTFFLASYMLIIIIIMILAPFELIMEDHEY